ncbi:unnamed protein product [Schistosoma curassoni]|uniref:Ovule protein n=1 Tax=Schistosoma curassoni TaxID=6186 RepID=A0A183L658_9TREM|nr:unnamed protein product [Schistosoma curassoni]
MINVQTAQKEGSIQLEGKFVYSLAYVSFLFCCVVVNYSKNNFLLLLTVYCFSEQKEVYSFKYLSTESYFCFQYSS